MTEGEVCAADLVALAREADGQRIVWTCRTDDLNLNLLTVDAEKAIAEHINSEVDVLVVGVEGEGSVTIDGALYPVHAGQAVVIPRGTSRSIRCEGRRFAYLTCHRRRAGLWPEGVPRRSASRPGEAPEGSE